MSMTSISADVFMYETEETFPTKCWVRSEGGELLANIDGVTFFCQDSGGKSRLIQMANLILQYANSDTPDGERVYCIDNSNDM